MHLQPPVSKRKDFSYKLLIICHVECTLLVLLPHTCMYNVYINKFSEHIHPLFVIFFNSECISRKLIYSIMFTWMGQYSYDDAYTVKKASDYLAIDTSGRYTSTNIGVCKGFAAVSSLAIAGNLHWFLWWSRVDWRCCSSSGEGLSPETAKTFPSREYVKNALGMCKMLR